MGMTNFKRLLIILLHFQSPAICVAAAVMNTIKSMNCWNGDIIDQVVIAGNRSYIDSSISKFPLFPVKNNTS